VDDNKPAGTTASSRLAKANWSLVISVIALLTAVAGSVSSWVGTIEAIKKNSAEIAKNTAELEAKAQWAWSSAIVYSIIEEGSKNSFSGISFQEILDKYTTAAMREQEVKIDKKKLQPLELKSVLMSLLETKLIYQTAADNYVAGRTAFILGGEVSFNVARASGTILAKLHAMPGEYTVAKLEQEVVKDLPGVTKEDYQIAINGLIGNSSVIMDGSKKLWSATNPPPKK
jgi:hypothetical protein